MTTYAAVTACIIVVLCLMILDNAASNARARNERHRDRRADLAGRCRAIVNLDRAERATMAALADAEEARVIARDLVGNAKASNELVGRAYALRDTCVDSLNAQRRRLDDAKLVLARVGCSGYEGQGSPLLNRMPLSAA